MLVKLCSFGGVKNKQIMLGCHRPSLISSTSFSVALIYTLLSLLLSFFSFAFLLYMKFMPTLSYFFFMEESWNCGWLTL